MNDDETLSPAVDVMESVGMVPHDDDLVRRQIVQENHRLGGDGPSSIEFDGLCTRGTPAT